MDGSNMSDKRITIDKRLIRDLADILNEKNLTEIEVHIEDDEVKLRVSRAAPMAAAVHHAVAPAPMAMATAPAAAPVAAAPAPDNANAVKSPMVGTAYRAPSPGAANFCEVGSTVKEGQTVLIIEAMKTMNQIAAPRSGKISAIFVDNGDPVEFGQPLIAIE
jgi:acetyl-CoA carboxylase biotin carboxyl carrier protein